MLELTLEILQQFYFQMETKPHDFLIFLEILPYTPQGVRDVASLLLSMVQLDKLCYTLCCVASKAFTPYCNPPPPSPLPAKETQPIAPTLRPDRRGGGVGLVDQVSGRSVAPVPNC
jgi:hypothetical protein